MYNYYNERSEDVWDKLQEIHQNKWRKEREDKTKKKLNIIKNGE